MQPATHEDVYEIPGLVRIFIVLLVLIVISDTYIIAYFIAIKDKIYPDDTTAPAIAWAIVIFSAIHAVYCCVCLYLAYKRSSNFPMHTMILLAISSVGKLSTAILQQSTDSGTIFGIIFYLLWLYYFVTSKKVKAWYRT